MNLTEKHCQACEGGVAPLTLDEAHKYLKKIEGWHIQREGKAIECTFSFKNYYHTMAFVNAVAFMAHFENHHPDIEVSYNQCKVLYTTHAIGGLSENDFICAAKVDKLFQESKGTR